MTIAERLLALRTTPPFDRLRDSELTLIAEVARVRRYAPGEILCSPEKPLRRMGVLVEGRIETSVLGAGRWALGEDVGSSYAEGQADACAQRPAPSAQRRIFGAEALLLDLPMVETWRAASPDGAVCLLINKGNLHTIVHECPGLVAGLLAERP